MQLLKQEGAQRNRRISRRCGRKYAELGLLGIPILEPTAASGRGKPRNDAGDEAIRAKCGDRALLSTVVPAAHPRHAGPRAQKATMIRKSSPARADWQLAAQSGNRASTSSPMSVPRTRRDGG